MNNIFYKSFKKIRITGNTDMKNEIVIFMEMKGQLKILLLTVEDRSEIKEIKNQIRILDNYISSKCAEQNKNLVKEYAQDLNSEKATFSQHGQWKLKSKLCQTSVDPPTAKIDSSGQMITSPNLLRDLYLKTYTERLSHRTIKSEYDDIYEMKTMLWEMMLYECKSKKSNPWEMSELEKVLKNLKTNKSRDPLGLINDIFKPGCMGEGLKQALLSLLNQCKSSGELAEMMKLANITSIWKKSGSRKSLKSERGIFVLSVFRMIMDRMLYNDYYPYLEDNMSPSNIGALRNKNIRNHLFILYGIINSVVQGEEECIDIGVYDVEQCFDALWLDDCMLDMHSATPQSQHNDKLALIYKANEENNVAVKTPVGITDRKNIPSIVMQGGTFGPMQCSNSIDNIGKKCIERQEHLFTYKNLVRVTPLAMVDDLLTVQHCNIESLSINTFINTQIEMKKLKFHTPDINGKSKCHKMHVGKENLLCPELKVHGTKMGQVNECRYLGDIVSNNGSNLKNVRDRAGKGLGIISKIMTILETVSFGMYYFEIALTLRESMFLNGILTNSDIWYNLKETEVEILEELDRSLLRQIFGTKISCPKEALFLESGVVPIGVLIKSKRINYLHYLVKEDPLSMLSSFFEAQWKYEIKNDWTAQVKLDLEDYGIPIDLDYFKSKSVFSFKKMVKVKAHEYALCKLNAMKKSKMDNTFHGKMEMQEYLKSKNIHTEDKKLLFAYRTRMANYSENFRGPSGPKLCPLCSTHLDNQPMAFICPKIKTQLDAKGKYENIFKSRIPLETLKNLKIILQIREENGL